MKEFFKYYQTIFYITIIILFPFSYSLSSAENNIVEKKPQEQHVTEKYDEIKKKQNRDYKTGAYDDNKKDYVKKWISEDINYHKRVIKLKSDYLAWAKEKISNNNTVNYYEYEPLKNLSDAEKKILLDYHNSLFKDKKTKPNKKIVYNNKKNKNINPVIATDKKELTTEQNDIAIKNSMKSDKEDDSADIYILYSIISVIIIVFAFMFFKKRNNRKR